MSETHLNIRNGDVVEVTFRGTFKEQNALKRSVLIDHQGEGYRVPKTATITVLEAKGFPWYGDDLRAGDCDRLPQGTILRTAEGAVFVKSGYQGRWLKAGTQSYATEQEILARNAAIIWMPESAK